MTTNTTKVTLVTGGSRGLGKNTALALARAGHDVLLTYRSQRAEADEVVSAITQLGRKAAALPLDVGQSSGFDAFVGEVQKALAQLGHDRLDALVNNAGNGVHASFAETTEAQLDEMFAVHFKGPFLLTQRLLPVLRDGGRIVNISSGLTRFSFPGYSAYASMKGAVEVLTHYLARELGGRGIAVNTLAPGAIETDFGGGAVRDNEALNKAIASQTALGRVGLPDDIGGAIASLLSDGSRWINAQRIEASGGMMV